MPLFSHSRLKLFLLFVVLLAIVQRYFFRPGTVYPGEYFNRGENAAWLGVEWVKDSHTLEEIETLADAVAGQNK